MLYIFSKNQSRVTSTTMTGSTCKVYITGFSFDCNLNSRSQTLDYMSPLSLVVPQVKQGFEPPTFTCHFLGWNPNVWAQSTSYEEYRKQVTSGVTAVSEELKKYDEGRKFKYEELKGKCPTGVDPTHKEVCVCAYFVTMTMMYKKA